MTPRFIAAIAGASLAAAHGVRADTITYEFTGTVTSATGVYGGISAGTTVTGTYVFNFANAIPSQSSGTAGSPSGWDSTASTGVNPGISPATNAYVFSSTATVGSVSYSTSPGPSDAYLNTSQVQGLTGGTGTTITSYSYLAVESSQPGPGFYPYTGSGFSLAANVPSGVPVWTSDGLPLPNPATDATGYFEFQTGVNTPQNVLNYNITSLSPVPLPAAAWLLLSGLGALGLLRRTGPSQPPGRSEA